MNVHEIAYANASVNASVNANDHRCEEILRKTVPQDSIEALHPEAAVWTVFQVHEGKNVIV
jgi:uncharacterized lipoprotein YajG